VGAGHLYHLIRLGEIIKQDAREYKEITRAELADYTGVSAEQIEEIEEDHTITDFDTALLICHYLDIDVDVRLLRLIINISQLPHIKSPLQRPGLSP
jgi:transcriptional regulator with XRE-family HTH domain